MIGRLLLGLCCTAALGACAGRAEPDDDDAATISAVARLEEDDGEVGLELDSATMARIGLETAPLRAVSRRPETELPGVVVEDPGATITVRAGVTGRLSLPEGATWPRLGQRLVEGTPIAQVGDARPVAVTRSGQVSAVHAYPGEIVQAGQELLTLVDYGAPLVRIAWDVAGEPPSSITVSIAQGGPRRQATLVGPAPSADPVTASPSFLYRVPGAPLRPGTAVTALVPDGGGPVHGVLVPSRAVVQWDALPWAYVERTPGRFVRVRVPDDVPVAEGWLATSGFEAGERVVVTGAGLLLSEEFRARITVGEEVGE
jgi:hypothetical protein